MYTIGETAKLVGLSSSALRYYDREGLLPSVTRTGGGIRLFSDGDLQGLKMVECLKAAGLGIKEIKQFMDWCKEGDSTLEKRRQMFYERKSAVEQQLKEVEDTLHTIEFKCWYYDTACQAGTEDVPRKMADEEMPEHIREYKKLLHH